MADRQIGREQQRAAFRMKDLEEIFLQAAGRGDLLSVEKMLVAGVYVDATDELFRQTALQKASYAGHVEVAQRLLEAGASVNAAGRYGRSSLHRACVRGHVDCAKLLLKFGADVRAVNKGGWGSLHYAAYACQADCVALLLEAGADPNFADRQGRTPLVRLLARAHIPPEDRERFHGTIRALILGGSRGWENAPRPYIFDLSQHLLTVSRYTRYEMKQFFSGFLPIEQESVRAMLLVLKRKIPHCEEELRIQMVQFALAKSAD